MASEEEQPEEFEENQENENIIKNEPKRQIIIKGRRIQKREKRVQFEDSDETESDEDKNAKHKNRKIEKKKEDFNRIFDFRNVFQNKLTGKILTHWNDNTKIEMNLSEAANTVINKFSNTSYDTIFSSNSKNNELENWDCGFEDSNLTGDTGQKNSQMHNEQNVILQEQHIKNDNNKLIETTNESIFKQVSTNKSDENDYKSKLHSTECNPDGITGKQILDKTFGTQIAPDIVSSFNSWFSDIRSATKLAASTTVSHAVKKLTNNAQHILTNVSGDQSDLIQTNSNALENCQTGPLKRETDSSSKIDLTDNWETNAWTDEWDDEPIQLNQSSLNTLKFEKSSEHSNKESLNSSIYQENLTRDDSKFSVKTDEKCLENVAYAQQNASAISPEIELNFLDYNSLSDDRNRDLNENKDSQFSQMMSEGNSVLRSDNILNNVASLDNAFNGNDPQLTNLDIDSNGWDMDWEEEKSPFEPVLENVIDDVLPSEEISSEQNELNVGNSSFSSSSSLTTDPSIESNTNVEESLVSCADGWDNEMEENDFLTEADQSNLQGLSLESGNNSEMNITTDLVDSQSDNHDINKSICDDKEMSIELNPTTIVEINDSVILPIEEVALNSEQSKIVTPQLIDSNERSDQPQVSVVSESNLPVQLAQTDDSFQETIELIKESGKDIHTDNNDSPSLTADSTKLELNDGWDNDWGQVDSFAKPNPDTVPNSMRSSFSNQPAEHFSRLSDKEINDEINCENGSALSTNWDVEWDDELSSKVSLPMENVQQSFLPSDLNLEVKPIPTNEIQNCAHADFPGIDLTHQSSLISSDNVTQYIPQINAISQSNWTGYTDINFSNDNTNQIDKQTSFTNLEEAFVHESVPSNEHVKMNTEHDNSNSYALFPQSIQNEEIKLDLGINLQDDRIVIEQDVSGGHDQFEPNLEQTEDINNVEENDLSYDDQIEIIEPSQQTEQIVSNFAQFNKNEINDDYGISHSPNLLSDINESHSNTFEQTDIIMNDWKSHDNNHSLLNTSTSGALQEDVVPSNDKKSSIGKDSPDYVESEIDDDQSTIGPLEYPQSKMDLVVHNNLLEDSVESDRPALNIDLTNEQILSYSEHKDDMWGDDWNNEWEDQLPEKIELSEQRDQLHGNLEKVETVDEKCILPSLESTTVIEVTKEDLSTVPKQQSSEIIDQWTGDWGDDADLVSNNETPVENNQVSQQSEQMQTGSNQPLHELERKDAANEKCLSLEQAIDICETKQALPTLPSKQFINVDNAWGDDTDIDIMKQDLSFLPKPQLEVIDQWTDDWGDDSDFVQKEQDQIPSKIDLDKSGDEKCQSLEQTINISQTNQFSASLSGQQLEVVDQLAEDWGDDSDFVHKEQAQVKTDDYFEQSKHLHKQTDGQISAEVELKGTVVDNTNDAKKQDLSAMSNQQLEVIDQWTDDLRDSDFVQNEQVYVKTGDYFEQREHIHKQTECDQIGKIGSDKSDKENCLPSLKQPTNANQVLPTSSQQSEVIDQWTDDWGDDSDFVQKEQNQIPAKIDLDKSMDEKCQSLSLVQTTNICQTNQALPALSKQQSEVIDQWTDDWRDSDFVQKEPEQVKTNHFEKQSEHKQAHLGNDQISDGIELKRAVENKNNVKNKDFQWTDWGDDSDFVQKEQKTKNYNKKSIPCESNEPNINSTKGDDTSSTRKDSPLEAKSDRSRNINENRPQLINNTKLNKTAETSLTTHKTKKIEVGNQNTLEEWTTDWDDPDPVILPSQERRSSTLTNISIDSDWSADWELKPKSSVAKLQPSASISSTASRHLRLNDNLDKPLQTQSDWKPVNFNQSSSNSFNSPNQSTLSRQSEQISYQTGSRSNTSGSSSWFSELKSATKNAAVTTMTHATSRWSFNPANLLDAVVDNISSAVGIPSAEEMATVMRKQQKSDKN